MNFDPKVLEVGIWAAGISTLGAVARIISQKMGVKPALATLCLGVIVGVLVGLVLADTGLSAWAKNAAIAVSSITGKELMEFILKVSVKLRDRSDKVADKIVDKI